MSIISDALKKMSHPKTPDAKKQPEAQEPPRAAAPEATSVKKSAPDHKTIVIGIAVALSVFAFSMLLKSIVTRNPAKSALKKPSPVEPVARVKNTPLPQDAVPQGQSTAQETPHTSLAAEHETAQPATPQAKASAADEYIPEPPPLNLSGIIHDAGGKSTAIIDGRIVNEGDRIGEVRILNIGVNKVRIEYEDREYDVLLE
jgi:hypothetical protein